MSLPLGMSNVSRVVLVVAAVGVVLWQWRRLTAPKLIQSPGTATATAPITLPGPILLTNDDGVDSPLLEHALIYLRKYGEVHPNPTLTEPLQGLEM